MISLVKMSDHTSDICRFGPANVRWQAVIIPSAKHHGNILEYTLSITRLLDQHKIPLSQLKQKFECLDLIQAFNQK